MSYLGKAQIDNVEYLIGSTLYGICTTSANLPIKIIDSTTANSNGNFINNHYDKKTQGSTIHVKFVNGNTVDSNVQLKVGALDMISVVGKCVCPANTIISFTLDENQQWVVNDNVNTEYVFKTTYDGVNNKALTESDIADAAEKDVDTSITSSNLTSTNLPTTDAVTSYVQDKINNIQLRHKLTFGAGGRYEYDGSADVTVPVYTGVMV